MKKIISINLLEINVIINQMNRVKFKQYINDTYNINLIKPFKNVKDKTISKNDEQILHDRFVIKNFLVY